MDKRLPVLIETLESIAGYVDNTYIRHTMMEGLAHLQNLLKLGNFKYQRTIEEFIEENK